MKDLSDACQVRDRFQGVDDTADVWSGIVSSGFIFSLSLSTPLLLQLYGLCKGNPNSLREQLSLKTNQGEPKVNI
jgi:hypothetical protein